MTLVPVNQGDSLQLALDNAQPGDTLELEAGATFLGNYRLRYKSGDSPVTIRSSRHSELPAGRIGPEHAHLMPKVESSQINVPALDADFGAHHYDFDGIEFLSNKDDNQIVRLGTEIRNWVHVNAGTLAELPHHLKFDRCYLHGHPEHQSKMGLTLNAADVTVQRCHIGEIHSLGQDSQAIGGWNGSGPFLIKDNYLEAAGENIMFGGADPSIADLVPSDIRIIDNEIVKPISWQSPIASGPHAGRLWVVKNHLELKNARRVQISRNQFRNNWSHAQSGTSVQLTPRNQNNTAPWSTVEDVTFFYNRWDNVQNLVNINSSDTQHGPSQTTRGITFEHNLAVDVERMLLELSTGVNYPPSIDVHFRHNTFLHRNFAGHTFIIISQNQPSTTGFIFRNNVVTAGQYGIHWPNGSIDDWFHNWLIDYNVVIGGSRHVPPGNFLAPNATGLFDADWRLLPGPYSGMASDGSDPGYHEQQTPEPDPEDPRWAEYEARITSNASRLAGHEARIAAAEAKLAAMRDALS